VPNAEKVTAHTYRRAILAWCRLPLTSRLRVLFHINLFYWAVRRLSSDSVVRHGGVDRDEREDVSPGIIGIFQVLYE
jgi:hypothetical protein